MHKLLPALALSCFSIIAQAQRAGITDSTFGHSGVVEDIFAPYTGSGAIETAFKVLPRGDGRFFCLGDTSHGANSAIAMRAYLADGSIDPSFNGGNTKYYTVDPYTYGLSAAMAPDGKIVISGFAGYYNSNLLCLRLQADGEIDSSYGTDGHTLVPPSSGYDLLYGYGVKLQADGKAVIIGNEANISGGTQDIAVVRLNADGSEDMSFNSSGIRTNLFGKSGSNLSDLAVLQSGKIAVVGDYLGTTTSRTIVTMRLNSDGSTDSTFGVNGMVQQNFGGIFNYGYSIVEQKDKKLIMAAGVKDAGFNVDLFLLRYNTDGNLDNTWGLAGVVKTHFLPGQIRSFLDVSMGSLLVGSRYSNSGVTGMLYVVAHYNNDGTIDNGFGTNGIDTIAVHYNPTVAVSAPVDMAVDGYSKSVIMLGNGGLSSATTQINLIKVLIGNSLEVPNVPAYINDLNFYPNPVGAEGHLRFTLDQACAPYITLQDVSGRVVQILSTSSLQVGNHELSIDMSGLVQGTYFVNSRIGAESKTMKLIKL
ncbi:MAG: T9SS type A sorting domain-containing protein [Bacteroidetes bacterium]|nr:T9SS type A sorting domain-containing protein [Bacteroidota bacterium]